MMGRLWTCRWVGVKRGKEEGPNGVLWFGRRSVLMERTEQTSLTNIDWVQNQNHPPTAPHAPGGA